MAFLSRKPECATFLHAIPTEQPSYWRNTDRFPRCSRPVNILGQVRLVLIVRLFLCQQTINGLWKIAWASVFRYKWQHINININISVNINTHSHAHTRKTQLTENGDDKLPFVFAANGNGKREFVFLVSGNCYFSKRALLCL